MPLQPLSDTVTIDVDETVIVSNGVGRPRIQSGIALQVGPGSRADGHSMSRSSVRPGDRVYFAENTGAILLGDKGSLLMVRERDILALDRAVDEDEVPLYVPPAPRRLE